MKLDLGRSVLLLLIGRLGVVLRHGGGRSAGGEAARGIGGTCGVRSAGDALFEARSRGQLDVLHVGHPEVPPGLASPDNGTDENHDVSENYGDLKSARATRSSFG